MLDLSGWFDVNVPRVCSLLQLLHQICVLSTAMLLGRRKMFPHFKTASLNVRQLHTLLRVDKTTSLRALVQKPDQVFSIANFLSADECKAIISRTEQIG